MSILITETFESNRKIKEKSQKPATFTAEIVSALTFCLFNLDDSTSYVFHILFRLPNLKFLFQHKTGKQINHCRHRNKTSSLTNLRSSWAVFYPDMKSEKIANGLSLGKKKNFAVRGREGAARSEIVFEKLTWKDDEGGRHIASRRSLTLQ